MIRNNWKEEIIVPLAEELAKRNGKKAKVLGPFGIGAKVEIILLDDLDVKWTEQDALVLVIEPDFENGEMVFNYETGETCDRYKPGTIGEINGLNNITARLPNSAEEIQKLLRFVPKSI